MGLSTRLCPTKVDEFNSKGIARSLVFCPIESWKMINDTGYPGLELALA
jgi:hypothetical protein